MAGTCFQHARLLGVICMGKSSSWGMIQKDSKFLFVERSEGTSRSGQWCPPGGGCKEGESLEDACIREVKEETGLDVTVENLIHKNESFNYFSCILVSNNQEIVLKANECSNYQWVSPESLLKLGMIMELKRMKKVFLNLGYSIVVPNE